MKTIKIWWLPQDHYGTVRAAYRSVNGKLFYPRGVGMIVGKLHPNLVRNSPAHAAAFDCQNYGAVYEIAGSRYVVEHCSSRVFKPLDEFLHSIQSVEPLVVQRPAGGGALFRRSELVPVENSNAIVQH